MKSKKKKVNNLKKKSIKNDDELAEKLELIDSWEGKLIEDNYKIEMFTVKNNAKRRPIIKIISDNKYKNIQGSLLKLRLFPEAYREMRGYENQNIYRLGFYYMTKGRYQGGPLHSYEQYYVLFSSDIQSIKEIENMLSKYTSYVKEKLVSILQDKWEGLIDKKNTSLQILKNPKKKDYEIRFKEYIDGNLDKFILGNIKYIELYQCPMKKRYQMTIFIKNKKKIILKLKDIKDFEELKTMISKYIQIKKNIVDE